MEITTNAILLRPKPFFQSSIFPNACNLYSFLKVRQKISQSCKVTGKLFFFYLKFEVSENGTTLCQNFLLDSVHRLRIKNHNEPEVATLYFYNI